MVYLICDNMKNDNGFTLVELLVTVALLGALSLIVGLGVSNMLRHQKEKQFDDYTEQLEKAGCVYAEHNTLTASVCGSNAASCQIKFSALVTAGLIEKDLTNPSTQKRVIEDNTSYIQINWSNNERTCKYEEGNL